MSVEVPAGDFARSYCSYVSLLAALGYEVESARVLERVAPRPREAERARLVLETHCDGRLNGELLAACTVQRMETLRADLEAKIRPGARRPRAQGVALADVVAGLPQDHRDTLADEVVLDGHRGLVKPRKMCVEEFQQILRSFASNQTIARQKLIGHLRAEMLKRGIDMSQATIEERFRPNPAVRTMPYCAKEILRHLGDEFRTGLVPIGELVGEEDADEWLRRAQHKLMFRSQSAMHKAIAEATSISYDSIHKALSGRRKAKRIQIEIKRCLEGWIRKAECGQEIDVGDSYRGVPVERLQALMPRLRRVSATKEAIYRALSERTGVSAGSIRRCFQNDGPLRFAPLSLYRAAQDLLVTAPKLPQAGPSSGPRAERRSAPRLARKTRDALARWRRNRDRPDFEKDFKDLRLNLIMKLNKQRRRAVALAQSA